MTKDSGDKTGSSRCAPEAASASSPSVTIPIANHARSLQRHISNAKFRQTSVRNAPVATGYEYVEIPLWEARHLLDVLTGAAQGIVTGGQDPQGLGKREARVEPGPKDAPK